MIDGYAEQSNYIDHLAPIWCAMPPELRGEFHTPDGELVPYAHARGITEAVLSSRFAPSERRLLVGSGRDVQRHRGRRHILVEHGAGQTYQDAPGASYGYAGGTDRGTVDLFICPSQRVADANLAVYPEASAAVVGSPRLDRWWHFERDRPAGRKPHVVISTHWNGGPCQESLSAWPEYRRAYGLMPERHPRWQISTHAHPRWAEHVRRDLQLPFIRSFDEVLATADVYVCDNSSTQYETAALGIPNVVVNATDYRRDVQHGLRFWSHIPGPQVDRPEDLLETVRNVLYAKDTWGQYAKRVADSVYDGLLDGRATIRAIDAILSLDANAQVSVA